MTAGSRGDAGAVAALMAAAAWGQSEVPMEGVTLTAPVPGTEYAVTVVEGAGEPRSVGSYAVRLYEVFDESWPFDEFVAGVVVSRSGAVDRLVLEDVWGDEEAEVIVVVRTTGSGGYVIGSAFDVRSRRVERVAQTGWLAWDADVAAALREAAGAGQ